MLVFGGDLFVVLNLIDFDKVMLEFGNFVVSGNFVVLVFVCVIFGLYVIGLIIVWRVDKIDKFEVDVFFIVVFFSMLFEKREVEYYKLKVESWLVFFRW